MDFSAAMKNENMVQGPAPLPVGAPFNYDRAVKVVQRALSEYDEQIDEMVDQADALAVPDQKAKAVAVKMAGRAKKLNKGIDKKRKEFVSPHNEYVKAVNSLAKSFQERLKQVEDVLKGKIVQFEARAEIERRKAEQAAQKAAEKIQRELDAEAEAAGVAPVKVDVQVAPEAPKVTRTSEGSSHIQKRWKFKITDDSLVPRQYLSPDEKLIKAAVDQGIREIPGVDIFQDSTVAIRT